jgi:hypothetical protein
MSALEQFFSAQQGQFGTFSFVDPVTGVEYTDCSLDQDELEWVAASEMRHTTSLVVRQNGSQ